MSFQPIVPFGGLAGWSFLSRTRESQQQAFNNSPEIQRDVAYFKDNISNITSAADLVADRRLLSVALGAFDLADDIGNTYFVQKVLTDGTLETDALANRLSDKRYLQLAKAFGFGEQGAPNTTLANFATDLTERYQQSRFDQAVGIQNADMRLAMGVDRELTNVLDQKSTNNAKWFLIMGTPTLRRVFESALNLPSSLGALDIDIQLRTFREKANKIFGSEDVAQFETVEKKERLVQLFLLKSNAQISNAALSAGSAALAILQSANG